MEYRFPVNLRHDGYDYLIITVEKKVEPITGGDRIGFDRNRLAAFLAEHCCFITRQAIVDKLSQTV